MSQDLRLIFSATSRAHNLSEHCLYDINSTVLRNRRVSLRGEFRVSLMGCIENDLARLKLAALRRSQQIQFLITFDFCQAAWLGDTRGILLGRESGVIG